MANIVIQGVGQQAPVQLQVDPIFQALRASLKPMDFGQLGQSGGHFGLTAFSGTIAAALAANSEIFSMRWTDTKLLFVPILVRAGIGVYTAGQTVANPIELELIKAAAFTTDYTANASTITPAAGSQKMRKSNMAETLFQANAGIKVCTTLGMTGSVKTLETAGIGNAMYPGNALGAADTKDLYNLLQHGGHPPVLGLNEGIIIRNNAQLGAAATFKLMLTILWAEVAAF